jgi:hypothetical protein
MVSIRKLIAAINCQGMPVKEPELLLKNHRVAWITSRATGSFPAGQARQVSVNAHNLKNVSFPAQIL